MGTQVRLLCLLAAAIVASVALSADRSIVIRGSRALKRDVAECQRVVAAAVDLGTDPSGAAKAQAAAAATPESRIKFTETGVACSLAALRQAATTICSALGGEIQVARREEDEHGEGGVAVCMLPRDKTGQPGYLIRVRCTE